MISVNRWLRSVWGPSPFVMAGVILLVAGCNRGTPVSPTDPVSSSIDSDDAPNARVPTVTSDKDQADHPAFAKASTETAELDGTASCSTCHREQYASYLRTHHSRSLGQLNSQTELVGKTFTHPASHGEFGVEADPSGAIVHTGEIVVTGQPPIETARRKVDLVVGSGAFAKSYLTLNEDGCFQVPLTYYVSKGEYAMSPGYDQALHPGFTRQISDQCLFCHAGKLRRIDDNPNQFQIHEHAIGCERCHGNGESHVAFYRQASKASQETIVEDQAIALSANSALAADSIVPAASTRMVHPAHITRSQVQSLCAQCHLQGNVTIYQPGQDAWSFKPGDDLANNKAEYSVGEKDAQGAFVGHFAQFEQSSCFLNSSEMTCVTCHDPHHAEEVTQLTSLRNKQCLSCHQDESCGVEHAERVAKNENRCTECHMPRSKSEVPHVAVTNHRIAVYPDTEHSKDESLTESTATSSVTVSVGATTGSLPKPIALLDKSPIDSTARRLNEAIAVGHWLMIDAKPEQVSANHLRQAIDRLEVALKAHPDESLSAQLIVANLIDTWLSKYAEQTVNEQERLTNWKRAVAYASRCESSEALSALDRMSATSVLASAAYEYGQYEQAAARYQRLTTLRATAADHYNLGLCYGKLSRFADAEASMLEAIRLDPAYSLPYRSLAKLYATGDPPRAQVYSQRAAQLEAAWQ